MENNIAAFLMMIRHCEGTADANGYRRLFGGKYFDDYSRHPHQYMHYTNRRGEEVLTSAAGAYQLIYLTWKNIQRKLSLSDFSPPRQDEAAIELIREAGAYNYVNEKLLEIAIAKCAHIWASLPGAGYAQPEHTLQQCKQWYIAAGGV